MKARSWTTAALVAFSLGGCGGAGALGDVLGGVLGGGQQQSAPQSGSLVAEIRSVNTRDQVLQVRTEQGENAQIAFDSRTTVSYRQQSYEVSALEQGDVVRMDVTTTNNNQYYTPRIEVQQSVQDRNGGSTSSGSYDPDRLYRIEGKVDQIDRSRGLFSVRASNGRTATVAMPYNPRSADRTRFEQLRTNQDVRVEGRFVSETRMDLERFY